MGDKKEIVIATANRAESNLLHPLIEKLKQNPRFKVGLLQIKQGESDSFLMSYVKACLEEIKKPDLVIIPTDRREMLPLALACYYNGIKIAHFEAGYQYVGGTWDDTVRWMITLCSDIVFCNGEDNYNRLLKVMATLEKPVALYEVGSTALDYPFDYSKVPNEPYDIIIYHPPTLYPWHMKGELAKIADLMDKLTIWIDPNGDEGSDTILRERETLSNTHRIISASTYPKPEFLGLLEKCSRLIGNSSCIWQEAPTLKVITVPIGVRNSNRSELKLRRGGSENIAKILEAII